MKSLFSCLIALLVIVKTAFGQYEFSNELVVKEGPVNKFTYYPKGFFMDGKFIYDLAYGNSRKIIVNQFDRDNYNLQSEKSFSFPQFGSGGVMLSTKSHKYFIHDYDQFFFEFGSNGEFGEEKQFGSIIDRKRFKVEYVHGVFLSNDSTKLLVVYKALDKSNKSGYCKIFRVFNEDFSLFNSYVLDTPDEGWGNYRVYDFGINNYGDCFMLEKKQSANSYTLTKMRGGNLSTENLNMGDLIPLSAKTAFSPSGDVYVGGVYGIKEGSLGKGFYVFKYNAALDDYKFYNNEFSREIMAMYETPEIADWINKNYDNGSVGIHNLGLKELTVTNNGSVNFVSEKAYYTQNHKSGQPVHYDDVVLSQFNASGEVFWVKRLPKAGWEYSNSAQLVKYRSRIRMNEKYCYIFFYDHKNNSTVSSDQPPVSLERTIDSDLSVMAVYQVDLTNGLTVKMYIDKEKFPNTDEIYLVDQNKLITCVNYRWVELTFPD
jgi:hypothetical protein